MADATALRLVNRGPRQGHDIAMHHQLTNLLRNLAAGLRLALFLRVSRLAFRIDVPQLLLLFVVSAAIDFGVDWVRYGPDAYFSWYGAGSEIFGGGLLLLTAALLALVLRERTLVLAVPVLILAGYPLLQLFQAVPYAVYDATPAWAPLWDAHHWLSLAWLFALTVRVMSVALVIGRPRISVRAVVGGAMLVVPILVAPWIAPNAPWWKQPAIHGGMDPRYPNPASEPVLATQQQLLDDLLSNIEDERPNVTDLYFVGVAGDAREDVFRKDVLAAQKTMDERWGTDGRSIVLVNNPRTLLETPVATATNLRETLNEIGATINADEDVVMVYLASHGNREHVLEMMLPPLELAPLTAPALRGMLDEAGIKWRIVVVSACYSGGFIDALKDDYTLVLTASEADRTSFGCGHRSEATYFGEALFQQGLVKSDSLLGAFGLARERVAERERVGGFRPPSNPQMFVGSEMADKLKELDRNGVALRRGNSI